MKTVFKADMVAHIWANQSQDNARTATNNLFFEGRTLYSYRRSWPLATHTGWRVNGTRVILLNVERVSNTTAKHLSLARRALYGSAHGRVYEIANYEEALHGTDANALTVASIAIKEAIDTIDGCASYRSISKIRAAVRVARERVELATIAAANYSGQRANIIKVMERAPMLPDDGCDDETLKAWHKQASVQVLKLRAIDTMQTEAKRAASQWIAAKNPMASASARVDHCAQTLNHLAAVKFNAKKAGKRLPSGLPSVASVKALIAKLKPAANLEELANVNSYGVRFLRACFNERRNGSMHMVEYYARDETLRAARALVDDGVVASLDALPWYAPLLKMQQRVQHWRALDNVLGALDRARDDIASGDSLTAREFYSDALREYKTALNRCAHAQSEFADVPESARAWIKRQAAEIDTRRIDLTIADIGKRLAEQNAAKLTAWRNGEGHASAARTWSASILLRIAGENIETSWGAFVPVSCAPVVQRLRLSAMRTGQDIVPREPVALGHFRVTRVRADGSLLAGCHDISAVELDAIAATLNLQVQPWAE